MDSDPSPATDAAEKRVEESRDQLNRHLDQLSEKLTPANLAASALEKINPTDRIKSTIKNKPILAAVLGSVVGLLAFRRWRRKAKHTDR